MLKTLIVLAPALLAATAAQAQLPTNAGAWQHNGGRIGVAASKLSLPDVADVLALIQTGEITHRGEGLDNVAEYKSTDTAITGTVYIFATGYADTALAAYGTDRAIHTVDGDAVTAISSTAVSAAGHDAAMLRTVYDHAVLDGHPVATASGFLRADTWLLGLRVTGPVARRADVVAALDALIAGIQAAPGAHVRAAAPLAIDAPCPPGDQRAAKLLKSSEKGNAEVLGAALAGGSTLPEDGQDKKGPPLPPSFPDNGHQHVCIRGTIAVGGVPIDLLQPTGVSQPPIVLAVLDDAGHVLSFEKSLLSEHVIAKNYGIGEVDVLGIYDHMPSLKQIADLANGRDPAAAAAHASVTFGADGNTTINVDPAGFK